MFITFILVGIIVIQAIGWSKTYATMRSAIQDTAFENYREGFSKGLRMNIIRMGCDGDELNAEHVIEEVMKDDEDDGLVLLG